MPTPPPLTPSSLLSVLHVAGYAQGQRVEFCAIKKRESGPPHIEATWTRVDERRLRSAARWLNAREGRSNLYLLANPLHPDARKRGAKSRATNAQCASRDVFLLDVDPVKVTQRDVDEGKAALEDLDPTGTRPEKLQASAEISLELRAFLEERLGVRVPLISSGRGRQLWLRIGGHHEDDYRARFIAGIKARFDRPGLANLDTLTKNVARLMRLPGSRNLITGRHAEVLDPGCGQRAPLQAWLDLVDELAPAPPKPKPRDSAEWDQLSPDQQSERVVSALQHIAPEGYETWRNVGFALAGAGIPGAYELFDRWSSTGASYKGPEDTRRFWAGFGPGDITLGTLYHLAKEGGWVPPTIPEEVAKLLPLAETVEAPRKVMSADRATELAREVLRGPKDSKRVVQDRRPTGGGKTTGTAREFVSAVLDRVGRYTWAGPDHNHCRLEFLPALARAGAVVWDEDLDGEGTDDSPSIRPRLIVMGARILDVGQRPEDGAPVVCKVPRFDCPGPKVPGWTSESVNERYRTQGGLGWNAAATVCRACPLFMASGDDSKRCSFWERKQDAAKADVLLVPHHAIKPTSGATAGRRALAIDEDPSSALVAQRNAGLRELRAFGFLLEAATDFAGADVAEAREKLEQALAPPPAPKITPDDMAPEQVELWPKTKEEKAAEVSAASLEAKLKASKLRAKVLTKESEHELLEVLSGGVEIVLEALEGLVAGWVADREARRKLLDVYSLEKPSGLALEQLEDLAPLQRGCERVLRHLGKTDAKLTDDRDEPVGAVTNLLPLVGRLVRVWREDRPAVIHVQRGKGRGAPIRASVPLVLKLPDLPILALDATGDPRLLELATGRPVELVEGELIARLRGVHLADVPVSRKRWKGDRKTSRGRAGDAPFQYDLDLIARHLTRVGARRVGLVTFKAHKDRLAGALTERLGVEVRTLHYGAERGSNVFEGWADAMVLAGTPFVHPDQTKARAALEGAGVEELLAHSTWEARRLPGGGATSELIMPGAATKRAYAALVHSSLEQALGRAGRGHWSPEHGVLVMAAPWPTRHRLRITTREREALEGPPAALADLLEQHVRGLDVAVRDPVLEEAAGGQVGGEVFERDLLKAIRSRVTELGPGPAVLSSVMGAIRNSGQGLDRTDPLDLLKALVTGLVAFAGGTEVVAKQVGVSARTARRWVSGDRFPDAEYHRRLLEAGATPVSPQDSRHAHVAKRHARSAKHHPHVAVPKEALMSDPDQQNVHAVQSGECNPLDGVRTTPHLVLIDGGWSAAPSSGLHDAKPHSSAPSSELQSPRDLVELGIRKAGSTKALGLALEVNVKTVRRWRRGDAEPGAESSDQLRAYLDLEAQDSRTYEESMELIERAIERASSLRALARQLGLSDTTVHRWRDGKSIPSKAHYEALRGLVYDTPEGYRDVKPGEHVPGIGTVFGPAVVPDTPSRNERAPRANAPAESDSRVSPGADRPTEELSARRESEPEQSPLEQLRAWASPSSHPGWLVRAARRAKGQGSLVNWIGSHRSEGKIKVDQDLALARVVELTDRDMPAGVRRYLAELAQLLAKRGAKPATPNRRSRKARDEGREKLANHPLVSLAKSELDARLVKRE